MYHMYWKNKQTNDNNKKKAAKSRQARIIKTMV